MNEFILLEYETNPKHTAIGKYLASTKRIVPLFHQKAHPWGVSARNMEQHFALELLLCDDIKLVTWMQPIYDNLRLLVGSNGEDVEGKVDYLMNARGGKTIEVEALTYIRGRSIPKQYMIVDEAENLTPMK